MPDLRWMSRPMLALGSAALIAGMIGAAPAHAATGPGSCSNTASTRNEAKAANGVSHGGGMAGHQQPCPSTALSLHKARHESPTEGPKRNEVSHGGGMAHHMQDKSSTNP